MVPAGVYVRRCSLSVAVSHLLVAITTVEVKIVDAIHTLHVHRKPFETIGEFTGHRRAFDARDLLEVSEL